MGNVPGAPGGGPGMPGQGQGDKDKDKEKKPKRQFDRKPPAHFGRRKRKRGGGGLAKVPKGEHLCTMKPLLGDSR